MTCCERDSVIVPIYKEKGDIQDCGNYQGIKLMSHTRKIWERIIERRLREETTIGRTIWFRALYRQHVPCHSTGDSFAHTACQGRGQAVRMRGWSLSTQSLHALAES